MNQLWDRSKACPEWSQINPGKWERFQPSTNCIVWINWLILEMKLLVVQSGLLNSRHMDAIFAKYLGQRTGWKHRLQASPHEPFNTRLSPIWFLQGYHRVETQIVGFYWCSGQRVKNHEKNNWAPLLHHPPFNSDSRSGSLLACPQDESGVLFKA